MCQRPALHAFYHQPELIDLSRILFVIVIINSTALVPRSKLLLNEVGMRQKKYNTLLPA
jgi:hypothetical protein